MEKSFVDLESSCDVLSVLWACHMCSMRDAATRQGSILSPPPSAALGRYSRKRFISRVPREKTRETNRKQAGCEHDA